MKGQANRVLLRMRASGIGPAVSSMCLEANMAVKRDRWLISGVPHDARQAAEKAAGGKRWLGQFIAEAIRKMLAEPKSTDGTEERLSELERRVEALEARETSPGRKSPTKGKARP